MARETPEKFLTVYDPIYFFATITEGIVTLNIDKADGANGPSTTSTM